MPAENALAAPHSAQQQQQQLLLLESAPSFHELDLRTWPVSLGTI